MSAVTLKALWERIVVLPKSPRIFPRVLEVVGVVLIRYVGSSMAYSWLVNSGDC